ncbi:hypothetical protein AVEN_153023-1 [Araneus ventricosus]|uniref:Uncharacterized protein n=1 Tax=Araneus ventricosus TaxID=182803 RepID=A0A4Y2ADQ0_ARAVE|nr:hypothetical protein AVEN_153023-1 [Araneus ventricosus]
MVALIPVSSSPKIGVPEFNRRENSCGNVDFVSVSNFSFSFFICDNTLGDICVTSVQREGVDFRKKFKRHFLSNSHQGSSDSANKFGSMTGQDFLRFMTDFIKHTRVTLEKLVLLLLENHQSLRDLPTLDLSKGNVETLLSF